MEKRGGNGRKGSGRGELGMYMYTRKEGCNDGQEPGRVSGWGKMEILGFNDRQYEQVQALQAGGTCRFCRWACPSRGRAGEGVGLEQRREAPSRSSTTTGRLLFPYTHSFIPLPGTRMLASRGRAKGPKATRIWILNNGIEKNDKIAIESQK
jgi:hypothetical protein